MTDRLKALSLDYADGGAWPFLVGGVICLVNSDNERDSILLTSAFFAELEGKTRRRTCIRVVVACSLLLAYTRDIIVSFVCLSSARREYAH